LSRRRHHRRQVRIYPKKKKTQGAFCKIFAKKFPDAQNRPDAQPSLSFHLAVLRRLRAPIKNAAPSKKISDDATFFL